MDKQENSNAWKVNKDHCILKLWSMKYPLQGHSWLVAGLGRNPAGAFLSLNYSKPRAVSLGSRTSSSWGLVRNANSRALLQTCRISTKVRNTGQNELARDLSVKIYYFSFLVYKRGRIIRLSPCCWLSLEWSEKPYTSKGLPQTVEGWSSPAQFHTWWHVNSK